MEEFNTLTKILREELIEHYETLRNDFDIDGDYIDEEEDIIDDEDYFNEEWTTEDNDYENLLLELSKYVKNNKYKNLLCLIIFNDVYEYIKANKICNIPIHVNEQAILQLLETFNINELIKKINTSNSFFLDLLDIFIEYQITSIEEEKEKNKKLIELTNNSKYIDKFKINMLDNIQKQYTKTRRIY